MSRFAWTVGSVVAVLASATVVNAQRGPAASPSGLPPDILALACAPTAVYGEPAAPLRITGGQDSFSRRNYAPGDLVTINAGTANGIIVGQEFYVRRNQAFRDQRHDPTRPITVHTAGWLKVYAVEETMALATVTHACDTIEVGDYLEPFTRPAPVVPDPDKPKPERDHYAHVLSGSDLRRSFGRGDFFTIDRGSSEGVRPGAQFVVYRNKGEEGNFLFELGEAVAVSVGPNLATLQVTLARDAMQEGDLVAERKRP